MALLTAGLGAFFADFAAADGQTAPPPVPQEYLLKDAIKKDVSGYGQEEGVPWAELDKEADTYIKLRRKRLHSDAKLAYLNECASKPAKSTFCKFVAGRKALEALEAKELESNEENRDSEDMDEDDASTKMDAARVATHLNQADFKALKNVSEKLLLRTLKLYRRWEPLESTGQKLVADGTCYNNALYTGLGLKAEMFFPDPIFRERAKSFYRKVIECTKSQKSADWDSSTEKAAYRLSMLLIWESRWSEADPILTKLSERKDSDFTARALYWKAYCANEAGNRLAAATLRGRLIRDFPISFHGLLLTKKPSRDLALSLDAEEPKIRFRTQAKTELNDIVRAVEVLQKRRAPELTTDMLDYLEPRVVGLEPEFRLYVAMLSKRSGDMIGKFKILSSLFKEHTGMISRPTLELFYPLKRFEVLSRYSAFKIDPMLIAALIRQESGFNEKARSKAGALGLMQLMPRTARLMERVSKRDLYDAKINVRLGVRYFQGLVKRFDGDIELALAAYNAGAERVDEWVTRYPTPSRILFLDLIPFAETRNYVALIVRNYLWYSTLYSPDPTQSKPQAGKALTRIVSLEKSW